MLSKERLISCGGRGITHVRVAGGCAGWAAQWLPVTECGRQWGAVIGHFRRRNPTVAGLGSNVGTAPGPMDAPPQRATV
jgi:hypothetical protein